MALTATIHGGHSKLKAKNANADTKLNLLSKFPPKSTSSVPTMFSFANKPEITATDISLEPKPRGAKNGAASEPKEPSILLLKSAAWQSPFLPNVKCDKNHTATEESKITEPAFFIKAKL